MSTSLYRTNIFSPTKAGLQRTPMKKAEEWSCPWKIITSNTCITSRKNCYIALIFSGSLECGNQYMSGLRNRGTAHSVGTYTKSRTVPVASSCPA